MLITISWILIIIALIVLLVIIIRKFPVLAILDTENIYQEKETKFKHKIIRQKVERDIFQLSGRLVKRLLSLSDQLSEFLQAAHKRLKKIKTSQQISEQLATTEKDELLDQLFLEYEKLEKEEDWEKAEEKLLAVISQDQQNLRAFFELANVYEAEKRWSEARQTYEHALKIAKQAKRQAITDLAVTIQEIYFSLAKLAEATDNLDLALDNIKEALEYEPSSPRYLDLILNLSIIKKDKLQAQLALDRLTAVNPDNQKLVDWQEQIDRL
ncbi:MAG: tetratricopeptide repeat protein [Patescibacteria group bacterium]|jgi:tetratricopeptide (TPR) repeat protein